MINTLAKYIAKAIQPQIEEQFRAYSGKIIQEVATQHDDMSLHINEVERRVDMALQKIDELVVKSEMRVQHCNEMVKDCTAAIANASEVSRACAEATKFSQETVSNMSSMYDKDKRQIARQHEDLLDKYREITNIATINMTKTDQLVGEIRGQRDSLNQLIYSSLRPDIHINPPMPPVHK